MIALESEWLLAAVAVMVLGMIRVGLADDVPPTEQRIHSQPSWTLASNDVELAVTRLGGHMAPVTFDRRSAQPIQPYYISPWQDEPHDYLPAAVLVPLRGDFFCLPFGGNGEPVGSEQHVPHGEAATSAWSFVSRQREADGTDTLTLSLQTAVRPGTITKTLSIVTGQPVVYTRHLIEGFAGPTPLGHHATLAMPEQEGAVQISVSPFRLGMTNPGVFSDPAQGEYQALASGSTFTDLTQVPTIFQQPTEVDCSRFPTRRGYADLFTVVADIDALGGRPAWTAAVNTAEGWALFSLRDPAVLPATVFWIENHGRNGLPWHGRNTCLGLEDVCGFFADGLAASIRPNLLTELGVPTAIVLTADMPTDVRTIQGAVRVPAGFDRVRRINFQPGGIELVAESGASVSVPVRHEFVSATAGS